MRGMSSSVPEYVGKRVGLQDHEITYAALKHGQWVRQGVNAYHIPELWETFISIFQSLVPVAYISLIHLRRSRAKQRKLFRKEKKKPDENMPTWY